MTEYGLFGTCDYRVLISTDLTLDIAKGKTTYLGNGFVALMAKREEIGMISVPIVDLISWMIDTSLGDTGYTWEMCNARMGLTMSSIPT